MQKRLWGFSFVELMVVFAIITILAAILYPLYAKVQCKMVADNVISRVGYERFAPCLESSERVTVGSLVFWSLPCGRPDLGSGSVQNSKERILLIEDGQTGRILVSEKVVAHPYGLEDAIVALFCRYRDSSQLYQALGLTLK